MFNRLELTPTLEEYSITIGMPLKSKLVRPPTGIDAVRGLAPLLRIEIHMMRQILKTNHNTCPLAFLTDCFETTHDPKN